MDKSVIVNIVTAVLSVIGAICSGLLVQALQYRSTRWTALSRQLDLAERLMASAKTAHQRDVAGMIVENVYERALNTIGYETEGNRIRRRGMMLRSCVLAGVLQVALSAISYGIGFPMTVGQVLIGVCADVAIVAICILIARLTGNHKQKKKTHVKGGA